MGNVYGFTAGQSGATFATIVIAAILGGFTNLLQERLYAKNVAKRGSEARLYLCMVGGLLFPSGIMIFAFSQGRGHWMGPCIGLVCVSSVLLPHSSATSPASVLTSGIFPAFLRHLSHVLGGFLVSCG